MEPVRQAVFGRERRGRWATALTVLLAGSLVGSCTAIVDYKDYDQFPACGDGDEQSVRDLRFRMDNMKIHEGQRVGIRVVNENNYVVARAILDPLVGISADLRMRGALQEGPHRVDFWADLSENGAYEPPPTDHAWRLDPCASGAYDFSHSTNFADISQPATTAVGGDFEINFSDQTPHMGQLHELWVIDQSNGRMVGYYRLSEPPQSRFTLRIPGIIEPGVDYTIALYADKNNNLEYDPPDEDHSWRLVVTGEATGLVVPFEHNTNFQDITEDIAP